MPLRWASTWTAWWRTRSCSWTTCMSSEARLNNRARMTWMASFIRLGDAVRRVAARRVVLDTIEALFGELPNPAILRAEIRRLFGWLKQEQLTAVITAERNGPDQLTRHGLEEYVSDCVI